MNSITLRTLALVAEDFAQRVLAFDSAAARACAALFATRRPAGRPAATRDRMIAAIAHAQGASLVARHAVDCAGLGITAVDPWQPS